jgi:response regulator RpfG family c-di-GMP phosphodiesterase
MKVLLIEDEKQLRMLEMRMLTNLGHDPLPCETAEEGLKVLEQNPDIPFVLLDMVLPGMSGLDFARKVRAMDDGDRLYILAVTSWSEDQLKKILEAGANDYIQKPIDITRFNIRIRIAEQFIFNIQERVKMQQLMCAMVTEDVLQSTLNGFIRVVTNVLSLVAPTVFGRSTRVARIVRELSPQVTLENNWELTASAMLSQIGCVTIPPEILKHALEHAPLSAQEQQMFFSHASNGADLISNVPRMQHIAEIIAYQEKHYDGSGYPQDHRSEDDIPAESRILKIALDLDTLLESGKSR